MITKVVVDSLINQINRYYIIKDAASKITSQLRKKYEEGVFNRIEDPNILADALTAEILSAHRDEHFHVDYNTALADEVLGNIEDVPKMVAEKLEEEKLKNYGFKKAEILPGNIGYLEISYFSRLNKYSRAAADAALKMLSGARALIIDLRYGKGGSPDMVNFIASHFFKSKVHLADIYIRCENSTLPYWTTPDSSYTSLNKLPIYILTSYRTFSAAEGLAYCMQNQARAIIVGETTRGGAHTVTYKPLSNGFVCDIPFGRVFDPVSKKNWEGTGIMPDIKVNAESALEVSELKIIGDAMAATKDSAAINSLRWELLQLKAANHPFVADTSAMRKYVGMYSFCKISLEDGMLFFQKPGLCRLRLVPMSNTVFKPFGNDSFVVEFTDLPGLLISNEDGRKEYFPFSKK
jgi:hypothetical protein